MAANHFGVGFTKANKNENILLITKIRQSQSTLVKVLSVFHVVVIIFAICINNTGGTETGQTRNFAV